MSAEHSGQPLDSPKSAGSPAPRDPFELLAEEFIERSRRGERPAISEYVARRPELASRIAALFPTLIEVEELGRLRGDGASTPSPPPPGVLGDFQILREIARGGMGIVYEAEQISLGRRVALKVLNFTRLGDERIVERFRREARSAAGLHHSNIVPVYGTGEADGALYYAMQFIDGRNLAEVLEEVRRLRGPSAGSGAAEPSSGRGPVPVSDSAASLAGSSTSTTDSGRPRYLHRAALIARQAADALAYAHGEGVLHRDIKPSNLLLDAKGNIWITDFGLAKAEGTSELTHTGDVVGTLAYLAPERLEGWSDPRSDVYSLGLTLYELLTLRRAFAQTTRAEVLQAIARRDPVHPRRIEPSIPRDLETIILKATDKNPSRRFATAREMADDLERFLEIRPILAKRTGAIHRAWRWCQRSKLTASFAATSFALLVLLSVGATVHSVRVTQERNAAVSSEKKADERLLDSHIASARWRRIAGRAGQRFESLRDLKEVAAARKDSAVVTEAVACFDRFDFELEREHPSGRGAIAMDRRLESYALGEDDGSVAVRRMEDGALVSRIPPHADRSGPANGLLFSPSGSLLAIAFEGPVGYEVRVVELASGRDILRLPSLGSGLALDFEPGERRVAVRGEDGSIELRSLAESASQPVVWREPGVHPPTHLAFDPSGKRLASLNRRSGFSVLIWDVGRGRVEKSLVPRGLAFAVAWHPGGRLLAVAGWDYVAYVLDVESGSVVQSFRGHRAEVVRATFSPSGEVLGTASWDGESRFWDVATGMSLAHGLGEILTWGADGRSAGFKIGSRKVGKWSVTPGCELRRLHFRISGRGPRALAVSSQGDLVAAACDANGLQVALVSGAGPWVLHAARTPDAAFLPDGRGLVAASDRVLEFPLERVNGVARFSEPRVLLSQGPYIAVSTDGEVVAAATEGGRITLVDLKRATAPRLLTKIPHTVRIAVSRGGRWIAVTSSAPPKSHVIDGQTGQVQQVSWGGGPLAFGSDDRWIVASAPEANIAREVGSWRTAWSHEREEGGDSGGLVAFLRDTSFVFAASSRRQLGLYEAASGREVLRFSLGDGGEVRSVAANGSTLAVGGDKYVQLWDLGEVHRELQGLGLSLGLPEQAQAEADFAVAIEVPSGAGPIAPSTVHRIGCQDKVAGLTLLIQSEPGRAEHYERRAEAFLVCGQKQEAIFDLGAALDLDPKQPATLRFSRAKLLESVGQLAECLKDLDVSLDLDPTPVDVRRLRGSVLDRLGREVDAMSDLERVLAESPRDSVAAEILAWILLTGPPAVRDAPRALELARSAVSANPASANAQRTFALACCRGGIWKEPRAAVEAAKRISAKDSPPAAYLIQSMALAKGGDVAGARQALQKGTARVADFARQSPLAPSYLRRLEEIRAEAEAALDGASKTTK